MSPAREPAPTNPVARVLPLMGLPHLDRLFDYRLDASQHDDAQPGVRVRVRFSGRLVDALIIERAATSSHPRDLSWVQRVISPEVVYPKQTRELVDQLAQRYAATRSDIIRAAIPPRHAAAEKSVTNTPWDDLGEVAEPDLSAWSQYLHGESFVDAVVAGHKARAAWQFLPGQNWAPTLAALAVKVVKDGGGALLVVPDQGCVDMLEAALRDLVAASQITVLGAGLGPQARYRRFLTVLHGQGRLVIGTRSAAYAPVVNLKLAVVVFDGDDNLVDPRAPYAHSREVLTTRASMSEASFIVAGYSRTAEAQLLVESGWAHNILAPRETVRHNAPRIQALADSATALERDPLAKKARIPGLAFQALRSALAQGDPVIVQVPRRGYIPTLACGNCRAPARCRYCNGPLEIPRQADPNETLTPQCRWCGRGDPRHRCGECGSMKLRAMVSGSERTAEELGRAFPNTKVIASGGSHIVTNIDHEPALVVSTPGAEPTVNQGAYGAAVLLDTWALLGRQDLRATEKALATWTSVAAMVSHNGHVVITADASLPVVQYLIRWDMAGAAAAELAQRREVGLPPAVHMAAIDGAQRALSSLIETVELPNGAEVLGPVDLPAGVVLPGEYDEQAYGPPQRLLIRAPLGPRSKLGSALKAAAISRMARKEDLPLRIQVDPIYVG